MPTPSQLITYDICYDNAANNYDVTNVAIVDTLPAETSFDFATAGGVYDDATHTVTWEIGTLSAGTEQQCVQMAVSVVSEATGTTIINSATIDSEETPPTTQTALTEICDNSPPIADPNGPYLGVANAVMVFDGTGSMDPDGDFLTFDWDWGDGTMSEDVGPIPEHAYEEAGIYNVCLTVDDGSAYDTACTTVVIYDPSAGFVTGGAWYDSPAGAYKPNPELAGQATFGFVSQYQRHATTPTGETEFIFHADDLFFHSESYEWLIINQAGTTAQFKGEGLINNELAPNGAPYSFIIWATDGLLNEEPDTFRIRIWYTESCGDSVIYDNGVEQEIGEGEIIVHVSRNW